MKTIINTFDKIGFTTSLTCAVHCIAMPFIITFLPYVGLSFFASEIFEWILLLFSAVLAISSICMGYKMHKNKKSAILLSFGLLFLFLGRIAHENNFGFKGVLLLFLGGATVAFSHFINNRLCNSCTSCNRN